MTFPIYFRKHTGYWYIDLRAVGGGQRSLKTKVKREALILARQIESGAVKRGKKNVPIEVFEEEYLAHSESTKAVNTHTKERFTFQHLRTLFPEVRYVRDVTPRIADRFVERLSQKLAPPSVNSYLAAVRSIFSTAVRWEYLSENPFKGTPGIPENDLPARILTVDEIRDICDATARLYPEFSQLWEFYLLTGARRSEALNLEWPEIDFERGTITLIKTKGKSKRKKKFRRIVMRPRVRGILMDRRTLPRPFPYKPHRVTTTFARMAKAAGVSGVSLHSFRSSFVSYIQDAGMPISFVSWIVGHASESITHNEYTGFYGDMIGGYFDKFERNLLPAMERHKKDTIQAVETPPNPP